jgi:hypothetical protein
MGALDPDKVVADYILLVAVQQRNFGPGVRHRLRDGQRDTASRADVGIVEATMGGDRQDCRPYRMLFRIGFLARFVCAFDMAMSLPR